MTFINSFHVQSYCIQYTLQYTRLPMHVQYFYVLKLYSRFKNMHVIPLSEVPTESECDPIGSQIADCDPMHGKWDHLLQSLIEEEDFRFGTRHCCPHDCIYSHFRSMVDDLHGDGMEVNISIIITTGQIYTSVLDEAQAFF